MKNWTTPEIATLEIKETANGFFNLGFESWLDVLAHDKKEAPSTPASSQN